VLAIPREVVDIIIMRIYEGLSRVYDLDWGNFSKQYVSLIDQLLHERGVNRAMILDLACGTGTLAIDLAHCGHLIHGIDISPEMITIAKSKSLGLPNVSFEVQDMTQFCVEGRFDLVTCTFDSVNYLLDTDDIRNMFRRVAEVLCESGMFIFDSNTHQLYACAKQGPQGRELGAESFVQEISYDPMCREATVAFAFSDGTVEIHKQRPYDLEELEPILADTGLRVLHAFSGFDRRPYDSKTEKLFCVAEKA